MKSSSCRLVFMAMVCIMSIDVNISACMTTFINDSNAEIGILNKNDKTFMIIPKNGKRRFGSAYKHAHFIVYEKQPKVKTQLFSPLYVCKQNECGNSGNVQLNYSDVQNNTGNASLFAVIKNKPYSPMVRELPMIKKSGCDACARGE